MPFSDRLRHWVVSLGGLVIIAGGIAWIAYAPYAKRLGIFGIVGGLVVFFIGFPNEAQRKGYRE